MIKTTQTENGSGWTLWDWGWRVELWYFRKSLGPHVHPGQHVEVMPLWGWSTFCRTNPQTNETQKIEIGSKTWFRCFSIPPGWPHWFDGCPVLFLNFTKGPSPAHNFEPYARTIG